MNRTSCDVTIIGMGLGAAAIAKRLAPTGSNIVMLPGAGHARFKHLEAGMVTLPLLERAFGDVLTAPLHQIGEHHIFRRDEMEQWAIEQLGDSVTIVEDFEEARALPNDSGKITLMEADNQRTLVSNSLVLTEGANPKIGIAARIRADFDPQDMIHYGRAIVSGAEIQAPITGEWRADDGVPCWYSAIPMRHGVSVAVSVRIENVMRVGRDARSLLSDFLKSEQAETHGIVGDVSEIGMELVPLLPGTNRGRIGAHNIMISPDANGLIDARKLNRFDAILAAGNELGAMMSHEWPNLVEWDEMDAALWRVFTNDRTPYHDDNTTGFIEDGPGKSRGLVSRLFRR